VGRKAIEKTRLDNPEKKLSWVRELMPMFQVHGFREVTMDQAAAYLNKSKATVYNYFESKEEIIELLVDHKLRNIGQFEALLHDENVHYVERYLAAAEILNENLGDISNLFLADLKELYPEIWQKIKDFQDYAASVLKAYYEEGVRLDLFNDIKPAILVASDRFLFDTLSDASFLNEHQLTIQEAFIEYFRMKFFGLVKKQED
jgi:AcrR family transcriptional regulator